MRVTICDHPLFFCFTVPAGNNPSTKRHPFVDGMTSPNNPSTKRHPFVDGMTLLAVALGWRQGYWWEVVDNSLIRV